jgi:PAT family beta-lactamase induction signal transducer AmpG
MGLSNTTLGFSNGIIYFVMPQLMAAAHVPEAKIAAITAIASIPGFTFFFFSPILDVRFSRRWYATVLAALSGTASAVATLSLHHLLVLQIALVIAGTSGLSSSALGGWLSNITPNEHKNPLSKWINIAIFAGTGLISAAGGEFVRRLPAIPAAILIGTMVFLPFPRHSGARTGPPPG